MKKTTTTFLFLLFTVSSFSQKIKTVLTDTFFIKTVLAEHNFYRKQVNVPDLQWSAQLAKEAELYAVELANTNTFKHSINRGNVGENLWMGTANHYSYKAMLSAWSDERNDFVYTAYPNCSKNGNVVGHYTQMIWKNTTAIGCAVANNGSNDYLVCRYGPAGNWIGEKPY